MIRNVSPSVFFLLLLPGIQYDTSTNYLDLLPMYEMSSRLFLFLSSLHTNLFSSLPELFINRNNKTERYIEIWYVFLGNLPTLLALQGTINWFWKGGVGLAVFMTDFPWLGENMLTRNATCYCLVTATARENINLTPRRIEHEDRSYHSFQYPLIPSNPQPPTSLSSLPLTL